MVKQYLFGNNKCLHSIQLIQWLYEDSKYIEINRLSTTDTVGNKKNRFIQDELHLGLKADKQAALARDKKLQSSCTVFSSLGTKWERTGTHILLNLIYRICMKTY